MSAVLGNFTAPNSPLAGHIRDLMVVRSAQSGLIDAALSISPIYDLSTVQGSGLSGEYPIETGYVGLSLAVDPGALTAKLPGNDEFPPTPTSYDSRPYQIGFYPIGCKTLVAALVQDLQDVAGIDEQSRVATRMVAKWSSMLYQLVMSAVANTGNYASGYTYDPGNITTATFDLVTACEGVEQRLRDANIDVANADITMVYARNTAGPLRTLNQILGGIANPTPAGRAQPMETLRVFIQEALGCRSLTMTPDNGRYVNAAGSNASRLSAAIAFVVTSVADGNRSFLKTMTKSIQAEGINPSDLDPAGRASLARMDGLRGMFGIRSEYKAKILGGGGVEIIAEAATEINLVDNTAAVLWTSVLT